MHKASGNKVGHKPANWLQLKQTQELIAELTAIQEIIGEDAEVFRIECGYESSIKEVSVKWFNGGSSVIID